MAVIQTGSNTGGVANVDSSFNLNVTLPSVPAQSGYVRLAGTHSNATDPAGLIIEDVRTSTQGRLSVGQPVMLLNEIFNYTALNSAIMAAPVTTMTVTVASGTLNLNPASSIAANAVARVATYDFYPLQADFATVCMADVLLLQPPQVNNVVEIGFIQCTGVAAPIDGAFFRYDATGTLKAVLNNNGTELYSATLTTPSNAAMHKYKIVCENDRVLYYIDGACQAVINPAVGLGMPVYTSGQPFTLRTYNGSTGPTLAQTVKVGYVWVSLQDAGGLGLDFQTIAAIQGRMGSQGQSGGTMGSTALYTNSLAAGAGVALTNTTAAAGGGLGGQFSALPTLAVGTDGVLSSYQNPLATAAIPGRTLYIRGVKLQGVVSTVLAGGPVAYAYSLAYGHTNVSLATTESATAKAPRRVPLGIETYAVTAAVGTVGSAGGVYMPFNAPIVVNPGEFVAIVAKNLGVVTTAGVITVLVSFDAHWE